MNKKLKLNFNRKIYKFSMIKIQDIFFYMYNILKYLNTILY